LQLSTLTRVLRLASASFAVTFTLLACSGPQPLNVAIREQDEQTYRRLLSEHEQSPRAAWFAWKAQHDSITVTEATTRDALLSTTANPFDARRDPQAVSLGAVLYKAHCMDCHGEQVDGRGPAMSQPAPELDFHRFSKRFAVTVHHGAPRAWFGKIAEGAPAAKGNPAMPAFKDVLAREQIWLAVTYLQSLNADAHTAGKEAL